MMSTGAQATTLARATTKDTKDTEIMMGSSFVSIVSSVVNGSLNLQYEAIIGQFYARRQACAGRGVREVVADVGEVRTIRAEARDRVERFGHREMR